MELEKKLKIIIVFLIIVIVALFGYICINKVSENKGKEESTKLPSNDSLDGELDEIVILVKDYYYKHNLVEEDNLERWNIKSSAYIGYVGEIENIKYYLVEGVFTCKDKSNTCVYLAVADDAEEENEFKIYVAVDESKEEKVIKTIDQIPPTADNSNVCGEFVNAVYEGEYHDSSLNIDIYLTLTLKDDGTYVATYKNSESEVGTYVIKNNKITTSACPSMGPCDEKLVFIYDISLDCSTIIWGEEDYYQYKIIKK